MSFNSQQVRYSSLKSYCQPKILLDARRLGATIISTSAWHVPHGTHTYFVDRLLGCGLSHVKTDILAKYIKFFRALRESPSMEVSVLAHIVARDIRTTTGQNLHVIHDLTSLDPWSCFGSQVKKILGDKLAEVPQQDWWRISYLEKLLTERGEKHYTMGNTTELTELIDSLCMN